MLSNNKATTRKAAIAAAAVPALDELLDALLSAPRLAPSYALAPAYPPSPTPLKGVSELDLDSLKLEGGAIAALRGFVAGGREAATLAVRRRRRWRSNKKAHSAVRRRKKAAPPPAAAAMVLSPAIASAGGAASPGEGESVDDADVEAEAPVESDGVGELVSEAILVDGVADGEAPKERLPVPVPEEELDWVAVNDGVIPALPDMAEAVREEVAVKDEVEVDESDELGRALDVEVSVVVGADVVVGVSVLDDDFELDTVEAAVEVEVAEFPAWETLPHERLSPSSDTVGRRLGVLRRLAHPDDAAGGAIKVLVAPIRAVLQPIVKGLGDLEPVAVSIGDEIPMEELISALASAAYARTDLVDKRGQFAVRGGIVDVFPPTEEHPVRLEFWGDTVEEIRYFKVADQRSLEIAQEGLWAPPCRELLLTDEVRARAREWHGIAR